MKAPRAPQEGCGGQARTLPVRGEPQANGWMHHRVSHLQSGLCSPKIQEVVHFPLRFKKNSVKTMVSGNGPLASVLGKHRE